MIKNVKCLIIIIFKSFYTTFLVGLVSALTSYGFWTVFGSRKSATEAKKYELIVTSLKADLTLGSITVLVRTKVSYIS